MSEHTEGELKTESTIAGDIIIVGSKSCEYICSITVKQMAGGAIAEAMEPARIANAEHLVNCWNSHDALLNQVKILGEACEAAEKSATIARLKMKAIALIGETVGYLRVAIERACACGYKRQKGK